MVLTVCTGIGLVSQLAVLESPMRIFTFLLEVKTVEIFEGKPGTSFSTGESMQTIIIFLCVVVVVACISGIIASVEDPLPEDKDRYNYSEEDIDRDIK